MKIPFWSNPNERIEIIKPTREAQKRYGHCCGSDTVCLDRKHIEALLAGKMLAWNDSEYTTFVVLAQEQDVA